MSKGERGGGDRGHGRTTWAFTPSEVGAMEASRGGMCPISGVHRSMVVNVGSEDRSWGTRGRGDCMVQGMEEVRRGEAW